jgi:hypothetical protein
MKLTQVLHVSIVVFESSIAQPLPRYKGNLGVEGNQDGYDQSHLILKVQFFTAPCCLESRRSAYENTLLSVVVSNTCS